MTLAQAFVAGGLVGLSLGWLGCFALLTWWLGKAPR